MPPCEPVRCWTKLTGFPRLPIICRALATVASLRLLLALVASCERSTLPDWSSPNQTFARVRSALFGAEVVGEPDPGCEYGLLCSGDPSGGGICCPRAGSATLVQSASTIEPIKVRIT